ncbi:hypothetical protein D3C72_204310 [compost metagenome]
MNRPLLAAACLSLALTLSGCPLLETFGMGGRVSLPPHVTPQTQPLMYQGDVLSFETITEPPLIGTARLTLLNEDSEATKGLEIPASELGKTMLKLEDDLLPGYAEEALNRYRLMIATTDQKGRNMESGDVLWVVSDRSIQPPPQRRAANGTGYPEVWNTGKVEDLEAFAMAIAQEDWKGQNLTLQRRELAPGERPFKQRIPSHAVLWEFIAEGEFPRYALPADLSGTGNATLTTPTSLKIVLSLSEPAFVITVTAHEAEP